MDTSQVTKDNILQMFRIVERDGQFKNDDARKSWKKMEVEAMTLFDKGYDPYQIVLMIRAMMKSEITKLGLYDDKISPV
jgi:hypothetical protein